MADKQKLNALDEVLKETAKEVKPVLYIVIGVVLAIFGLVIILLNHYIW